MHIYADICMFYANTCHLCKIFTGPCESRKCYLYASICIHMRCVQKLYAECDTCIHFIVFVLYPPPTLMIIGCWLWRCITSWPGSLSESLTCCSALQNLWTGPLLLLLSRAACQRMTLSRNLGCLKGFRGSGRGQGAGVQWRCRLLSGRGDYCLCAGMWRRRDAAPSLQLGQLFTIVYLQDEVAELAAQYALANGGSVDHSLVNRRILEDLDRLNDDRKIRLLERERDALMRRLKKNTTDQMPESRHL